MDTSELIRELRAATSGVDVWSLFRLLDADRNGTIECSELKSALLGLDIAITARTVEQLFATLDKDGNGKVGCAELERVFGAAPTTDGARPPATSSGGETVSPSRQPDGFGAKEAVQLAAIDAGTMARAARAFDTQHPAQQGSDAALRYGALVIRRGVVRKLKDGQWRCVRSSTTMPRLLPLCQKQ